MKEYLGTTVKVMMDRPMGSRHPQHGFVYPVNYGYLPNTMAPDGEEIDAYVLGVFEPLEEFEGVVKAIIHRLDDVEDKLVVCSNDCCYSREQIQALTEFQERFFQIEILMESEAVLK